MRLRLECRKSGCRKSGCRNVSGVGAKYGQRQSLTGCSCVISSISFPCPKGSFMFFISTCYRNWSSQGKGTMHDYAERNHGRLKTHEYPWILMNAKNERMRGKCPAKLCTTMPSKIQAKSHLVTSTSSQQKKQDRFMRDAPGALTVVDCSYHCTLFWASW